MPYLIETSNIQEKIGTWLSKDGKTNMEKWGKLTWNYSFLRLSRAQVKILALYLNAYSDFLSICFLSYRISFTRHFFKNHLIPNYHSSNFVSKHLYLCCIQGHSLPWPWLSPSAPNFTSRCLVQMSKQRIQLTGLFTRFLFSSWISCPGVWCPSSASYHLSDYILPVLK